MKKLQKLDLTPFKKFEIADIVIGKGDYTIQPCTIATCFNNTPDTEERIQDDEGNWLPDPIPIRIPPILI